MDPVVVRLNTRMGVRRSGWPVVLAYCLVGAANQMVWLTYAPVTTVAAERFGVSETAVGWLANLFPLLYLPIAIPAGLALDRWFRPTLLLGAVLTAVGALVRLVDETFAWALLGQVLVAVAQPFVLNAATSEPMSTSVRSCSPSARTAPSTNATTKPANVEAVASAMPFGRSSSSR